MRMTTELSSKVEEIRQLTSKRYLICKQINELDEKIQFEYLPLFFSNMDAAKQLLISFLDDVNDYSAGIRLIHELTVNENRDMEPYFRKATIERGFYSLQTTLYDGQILFSFEKDKEEVFSLYYWYKSKRKCDFHFYKTNKKISLDMIILLKDWIKETTTDFADNLQDVLNQISEIYFSKEDEMCDFINSEKEKLNKKKNIIPEYKFDVQKDFIDLF